MQRQNRGPKFRFPDSHTGGPGFKYHAIHILPIKLFYNQLRMNEWIIPTGGNLIKRSWFPSQWVLSALFKNESNIEIFFHAGPQTISNEGFTPRTYFCKDWNPTYRKANFSLQRAHRFLDLWKIEGGAWGTPQAAPCSFFGKCSFLTNTSPRWVLLPAFPKNLFRF